jgi:hypothetical protein
MTAALVGPLRGIRFNNAVRYYDLPRDTLDPRYEACHSHYPACDCREASMAECLAEHIAEMDAVVRAANDVLDGHPTYPPSELHAWNPDGPGAISYGACMCTGCQISRRGHLRYFESRKMQDAVRAAREAQDRARFAVSWGEDVPF